MKKLLILLLLLSSNSMGQATALETLLQCIKQAKTKNLPKKTIQNSEDLIVAGTKYSLTKINQAKNTMMSKLDGVVEKSIYSTNLFARTLNNMAFGGEKSAIVIADFLNYGLQNKKISQELVESFISFLDKYNKKIGRSNSSDALLELFKNVNGKLDFKLGKLENSFSEILPQFKKLKFKNNKTSEYFLSSVQEKLNLNYQSYKSILNSIQNSKLEFQSKSEIDEFIRFIQHIDSFVQPKKDLLLRESSKFTLMRRDFSLDELIKEKSLYTQLKEKFLSYFYKQSELPQTIKTFHKQEKYRSAYLESSKRSYMKKMNSYEAEKLARKDADTFANLRYTCRARGKSRLRNSSASSFKSYAFGSAILADSVIYTFNGGFQQEQGKNIFIHNILNKALIKYINPKIQIGESYTNMQKILYTYFSRFLGNLLDKKTFEVFIENNLNNQNVDYESIFSETEIMQAVNLSISQLSHDSVFQDYMNEVNSIRKNELTSQRIQRFIKDQNLQPTTEDEEEQFLLNIIAANLIRQQNYLKVNAGKPISTGTLAGDRAAFFNGYIAFSVIKNVLVSQLVYTSLCDGYKFAGRFWGGKYNPAQAKAISANIFLINVIGSTLIERLGLEYFTGQK